MKAGDYEDKLVEYSIDCDNHENVPALVIRKTVMHVRDWNGKEESRCKYSFLCEKCADVEKKNVQ
jgi:hypothetical protein